jgi:hypothetical protein
MSQTKLSLAGKNFIPGQGEFGKSHPGGAGKPLTLFYSVLSKQNM